MPSADRVPTKSAHSRCWVEIGSPGPAVSTGLLHQLPSVLPTLLGSPSLVTLKHDTEGPTMKVRITRACGEWVEGDEPEVNADYGKQLIENGLAEEVGDKPAKAKRKRD